MLGWVVIVLDIILVSLILNNKWLFQRGWDIILVILWWWNKTLWLDWVDLCERSGILLWLSESSLVCWSSERGLVCWDIFLFGISVSCCVLGWVVIVLEIILIVLVLEIEWLLQRGWDIVLVILWWRNKTLWLNRVDLSLN